MTCVKHILVSTNDFLIYGLPVQLILPLLPELLVLAPSKAQAKSLGVILKRSSLCRLIFLLFRAPICLLSV